MEQARYWMWKTSRPRLSTQIPRLIVGSACNESWEEKAFAKDTAGHLGSCVWPPRSYSCSFCRREFRSAQALGGHMNVHRRDRAKLRQSSSLSEEAAEEHHQPQVSTLPLGAAANPNPNSGVLASPVSPRVPAPATTRRIWIEETLFSPSLSSSTTRENVKEYSLLSTTTPLDLLLVPELKLRAEDLGSKEFGLRRWRDIEVCDEEANSKKRRRCDHPTPAFFLRTSSAEQQQDRFEVLNPITVEDLDLELRLGDAPLKIK
ncbi:hypothetical protein B296_00023385 [Ensete ventricosum]|uniref:C2H2-type domain-containing protein n=1 Tax=Ensete ventricosum TaxID=4639 RepID=A0A427AQD7_ENSVE|nr:hypothetical protein B296_00023385 [Ensete ventricosum]